MYWPIFEMDINFSLRRSPIVHYYLNCFINVPHSFPIYTITTILIIKVVIYQEIHWRMPQIMIQTLNKIDGNINVYFFIYLF